MYESPDGATATGASPSWALKAPKPASESVPSIPSQVDPVQRLALTWYVWKSPSVHVTIGCAWRSKARPAAWDHNSPMAPVRDPETPNPDADPPSSSHPDPDHRHRYTSLSDSYSRVHATT